MTVIGWLDRFNNNGHKLNIWKQSAGDVLHPGKNGTQ